MLPFFSDRYGNAASRDHVAGHSANSAVSDARADVARLVGCSADDLIFTSGATESNNLAILGVAERYAHKGKHIVSVATEHPSVLDPLAYLQRSHGYHITLLPVDSVGLVDIAQLEAVLRPDTILVTVMAANNEIGTLAPLGLIGEVTRRAGVLFHTDATQAAGHVSIDVESMHIDLLSLSAHKFYGPKGVGALYARPREPRVELGARQFGGGHERGWRSGTLNVPGIVGLGAAARVSLSDMAADAKRLSALRETLWVTLKASIADLRLHGHATQRLPHNLAFAIPGVRAKSLVVNLPDLAFSTGSACASVKSEPSHVLRAIGLTEAETREGVRMGLGRSTTLEHVEYVARRFVEVAHKLRRLGTAASR